MTLDEQLAMATNSAPMAQPAAAPVNPAQMQAEAQVVQPTQTVMQTPIQGVQTMQVNQPAQNYVAPVATPNTMQTLDLDKASEEAQQNFGVQEITLGQIVSTRPIDPIRKMDKGDKMRFTIISNQIGTCKIHNHPTLNKIACFSTDTHIARCCQDMDEPKLRYYLPVLVYPTLPNDPKTIIPNGKPEMKLLVIWDTGSYNNLVEEIVNADVANPADNWKIDFVATSEDTYGKLSFRGQRDSHRQEFAPVISEMETKWTAIKDKAPTVVRKNMNEDKYIRLTQMAPVPQMNTYNQEDIVGLQTPDNY